MALVLYRKDFGRFPSTSDGLDVLVKNRAGTAYLTDTAAIPNDPWGTRYRYEAADAAGTHYRVTSFGGDSRAGGTGLDAGLIVSDTSSAR
jgi:type II secretory pathway pseudopilin PulG